MEKIVTEYLKYVEIPISKRYVEKSIAAHPDYPSILSISDVLQRLGVEHQVGKMEKKYLSQLSFPFLLHSNGRMTFIKDHEDLATFKKATEADSTVVIKAEPTHQIVDEENNKQFNKENVLRYAFITLAVALPILFLLSLVITFAWVHFVLLLTALSGVAIGYLLLAKDLGITYKPVEAFCNASKRTNCDRILRTEDAEIFSFFTFTDAAASYFMFQLITVGLFSPLFEPAAGFLWVLTVAGICAIPIIVYSLYYQYVKAHTWCRLCLIVDGLLAIQVAVFIDLIVEGIFLTGVSFLPVAISLLLFIAIACGIILIKNRIKDAKESARNEIAALRVKHHPDVFAQQLFKQEKIDTNPFEQEITIGNKKAPLQIMLVVNLHCNPCRMAYQVVEQLLATYPDNICFSFRLTQGMDKAIGEYSASTYFIRYWQRHIKGSGNEQVKTKRFISDWYDEMNPEAFAKQYPADGELETDNKWLDSKHYEWVKENNIAKTPTIVINGFEIPGNYTLNDFMAMTPGLAARFEKEEFASKVNQV